MKKIISIILVLIISGFATLYGKKIRYIIKEKPQNKTVAYSIFSTGYSSPIYKKSKAKITLTICKFSKGQQEIVWQSVVDKGSVLNYPGKNNAVYREVCIYNTYDKQEILAAYYEVSYSSKGSTISYKQGIPLSPGTGIDSVQVSL